MAASSVTALVSTKWLSDALGEQQTPSSSSSSSTAKLRVLDVAWMGHDGDGRGAYCREHIPGSVHFDLTQCRDKSSSLHLTPPSEEDFARYVGDLGIDNETHVIVYENHPRLNLLASPRTWWMFRLFGHEKVSILDGGIRQWKADGYSVDIGDSPVVEPRKFTAKTNPKLIEHYDKIIENQSTEDFQLVDGRPTASFDGTNPPSSPDVLQGCILKSVNIPFTTIVQKEGNCVKGREDLLQLFQSAGIDLGQPMVCHCHVGLGASSVVLAAFVAGRKDVALYDGGWEEFSKKAPKEACVITPYPKE